MPTSSACTIKSLASCGNPSFSARDLALFCADTAGGLPRMKRSRTSESETVFIFIKRPEQLHVRIMTILPTQIEDSYRIRCFLYKDSASKAELKSRLTQTGNFGAGPNLPRTSFTMTCRYAIGGYESRLAASLTYLSLQHNMTVLWRTPTHYSGRPSPTTALSRSWAGVGWVSCTRPRTSILAVLSR